MIKKTLRRLCIGFVLGIIIGNVIAHLTGGFDSDTLIPVSNGLLQRSGSLFAAQVIQTVISGLYGAIAFAGIGFYDIEGRRWNLAAASLSHYLTIAISYIPIAFWLDWLQTPLDAISMAAIQAVVYFIIFLIMSLIYKAQVKELNEINSKNHSEKRIEGGGQVI